MQIILAKTAGFCFGVNRAVKLTYELLEQGRPVATLGPLIHNPQVVEDLESKGAITCDSVDDVPDGCEVVIRSHGVGQSVYDKISTRRLAYHDATCPFVTKIHKIAARAGAEGAMLLVAGDAKHPEVQGIVGHTTGKVEVFANLAELEKLLPELTQQKSIFAVAQTTFNVQSWETCKEFLKNQCTNAKIFDTICSATHIRQTEAAEIAAKVDVMVVVGDPKSANTKHLTDICRQHCSRVFQIESADELPRQALSGCSVVGLTAGASTPASIIKEVKKTMSEEKIPSEGMENFAEMFEQYTNTLNTGDKVTGVVTAITPTEVHVDLGCKQAGYIPVDQLTDDPTMKPEDVVKVGDEVELCTIVNGKSFLNTNIFSVTCLQRNFIFSSGSYSLRRNISFD